LERIRTAAGAEPIEAGGARLTVTVSIGAVAVIPGTSDPASFIALADQQLYAAKNGGRDCVRFIEMATDQESSLITPRLSAYNTMSV
jgi:PleD family two-component response regulator